MTAQPITHGRTGSGANNPLSGAAVSRGFDGKVKLTKRAQREARANDDAPEGEGRAAG